MRGIQAEQWQWFPRGSSMRTPRTLEQLLRNAPNFVESMFDAPCYVRGISHSDLPSALLADYLNGKRPGQRGRIRLGPLVFSRLESYYRDGECSLEALDGFGVLFHELLHGIYPGGGLGDWKDYEEPWGRTLEEGGVQWGVLMHLPRFLELCGAHDLQSLPFSGWLLNLYAAEAVTFLDVTQVMATHTGADPHLVRSAMLRQGRLGSAIAHQVPRRDATKNPTSAQLHVDDVVQLAKELSPCIHPFIQRLQWAAVSEPLSEMTQRIEELKVLTAQIKTKIQNLARTSA
jgi:hypothetical protein